MNARPGTVYLVGGGPGDPELITVKGLKLLQQADVIVHDRLAPRELLTQARPNAEIIDAGKTPDRASPSQESINTLIVERAGAGKSVVRLKGGDPFVFGRGGEELSACRDAGIPCIVIPGVCSALAAPAAAGIPVTHRSIARSLAVVTARSDAGDPLDHLNFTALTAIDTVIVLMGRSNLAGIAAGFVRAGRHRGTPAACIASATTPNQRVVIADLETIADAADRANLAAPVVIVVGDAVTMAHTDRSWATEIARLTE